METSWTSVLSSHTPAILYSSVSGTKTHLANELRRFISNTERNGELINAIHHEGATSDNEFLRMSYEYVDRILRNEYAEYGTFLGREHRIFPWKIQMSHEFDNYNVPIQGLHGSTPATAYDALLQLDGLLGENFFNYMSVFTAFAHGSFQYPFNVPQSGNTKVDDRDTIPRDTTELRQRVVTAMSSICDLRLLFRTDQPLRNLYAFPNIFSLLRVVFGNGVTEDLITQLFRDLRYHVVKHFPLELKNRAVATRFNKAKYSNEDALTLPFPGTLWTRATQKMRDDELYLANQYGYSRDERPKLPPVRKVCRGARRRTELKNRKTMRKKEMAERTKQMDISRRQFMNQPCDAYNIESTLDEIWVHAMDLRANRNQSVPQCSKSACGSGFGGASYTTTRLGGTKLSMVSLRRKCG